MRLFFAIVCALLLSEIFSSAVADETSEDTLIIDQAFDRAFTFVKTHKLEAPEASRIYVLTAIAAHDVFQIKNSKTPYFSTLDFPKETVKSVTLDAVISEIFEMENNSNGNIRNFEKFSNENSAKIIAFAISSQMPKAKVSKYTEKGLWVSENLKPVSPEWKNSKLLEIKSANQFRPKGPPAIYSDEFKKAKEVVEIYGGEFSDQRRSEESFSARLWMGAAGTITSPGHWNKIALSESRDMATSKRLTLLLNLNIAMYDAGISAWDAKYHYNFFRPITAINLDDPEFVWRPMAETPQHPEYVSGHSTFSGAAATILTAHIGTRRFCATFEEAWDQEKCFDNYWDAAEDAGRSRIYGGLHFDFSNQDGLALGRTVATYVLNRRTEN